MYTLLTLRILLRILLYPLVSMSCIIIIVFKYMVSILNSDVPNLKFNKIDASRYNIIGL